MSRAVFLDRDGTLIRDVHYLKDPNDVKIINGVGEALRIIKRMGYLIFLHTNQSGIARGYYDWSDVHSCNERMLQEFGLSADFFDDVCIAPESPDQVIQYRKPSILFQQEMIVKFKLEPSNCWMIGDKWIDPQTGLDAGMRGGLVRTGKLVDSELEELAKANKVQVFPDVLEFVKQQLVEI